MIESIKYSGLKAFGIHFKIICQDFQFETFDSETDSPKNIDYKKFVTRSESLKIQRGKGRVMCQDLVFWVNKSLYSASKPEKEGRCHSAFFDPKDQPEFQRAGEENTLKALKAAPVLSVADALLL